MKKLAFLLTILMLLTGVSAKAIDGTWTNNAGDRLWSTAGNWQDGNIASGADATAYFTNATGGTITNTYLALTNCNFFVSNANYTVTGGTNVLDGTSGTSTFTVASSRVFTNLSLLTGTNRLLFAGGGTLALGAQNTFSGGVILNSGTISLPANSPQGQALGTGPLTINGGILDVYGNNQHTLSNSVYNINSNFVMTAATSGGGFGLKFDVGNFVLARTTTLIASNNMQNVYIYSNITDNGNTYGLTLVPAPSAVSLGTSWYFYSTNSSYSGKTILQSNGYLQVYSIQSVGGGNSSLGAPTTVANGTIDIYDNSRLSFAVSNASACDRVINFCGSIAGTTNVLMEAGSSYMLKLSSPITFNGSGAKELWLVAGSYPFSVSGGNKNYLEIMSGITNAAGGSPVSVRCDFNYDNTNQGTNGTNNIVLSGVNTFSGPLIVEQGGTRRTGNTGYTTVSGTLATPTITIGHGSGTGTNIFTTTATTTLANNTLVNLRTKGIWNLGFAGTQNIGRFQTNGINMAVGTYGTNNVQFTNTTFFTGNGILGVSASDGVWTNKVGGLWATTNNWDSGLVATGLYGTAYFTNAITSSCTVTNAGSAWSINSLVFSNVTVGTNFTLYAPSLVFQGGGHTIAVNGNASTATVSAISGASGLRKTGDGTLNMCSPWSGSTTNEGGRMVLTTAGGDVYQSTDWTIKSGATLQYGAGNNNIVINSALFNVLAGGTLDFNGCYDTIGAFAGAGIITNMATLSSPITLNGSGSSNDFSGSMFGTGGWIMNNANIQRFSGTNYNTGTNQINSGTVYLGGNQIQATNVLNIVGGYGIFLTTNSFPSYTARRVNVSSGTLLFDPSFPEADIPFALTNQISGNSAGYFGCDGHTSYSFDFNTPRITNAIFGSTGTVVYTGAFTPATNTTPLPYMYRLGIGGSITMEQALNNCSSVLVGYRWGAGTVALTNSQTIGNGGNNGLYVGVAYSGVAGNGTLDLTNCPSVTINVSNLLVGICALFPYPGTGTSGNPGAGATGTLRLGTNVNITAKNFVFGGGEPDNNTGINAGCVGTITTLTNSVITISTPVMAGGTAKGTSGTFTLNTSSVLTIGSPSSRTQLILGRNTATANTATGTLDCLLGTANLYFNNLYLGYATAGATMTGNLYLSTNSNNNLNISGASAGIGTVRIGYNLTTGTTAGTLTIGNAGSSSSITSTDNGTAVLIANNGSGTSTGTLTINGGSLTITTTGSAIAGGGGTSRLNLKDCTLIAGASSTNWIQSLTSATLTNTVTFDTAGFDITIPQVFSGAGSLIKTNSGTLVLSGTNTYSGTTLVGQGSIIVSNNLALQNSAYDTTGAGTLSFAGNITVPTLGGLVGSSNFVIGSSVDTLTLNVASTNIYTGVLSNSVPTTIIKSGSGKQVFGGSIACSNANIVISGGTIVCTNSASVYPTNAAILMFTGTTNALDYVGTNDVSRLVLNGINQPVGTYGTNGVIYTNTTYFTGEGALNVLLGNTVTNYFWTNSVGGNWSVDSNWTNTTSTINYAPVSDRGNILTFSKVGISATNDIMDNFLVNRMVFTQITTNTGFSLVFTNNGVSDPTIAHLNSVSVLANSLRLDNNLTISGASGAINLSSNITGVGSITQAGNVILTKSNSFTGGYILNSGTLTLNNNNSIGTNTLTINGGTILDNIQLTLPNNPIVMNGNWTHQDSSRNIYMGAGRVTVNSNVAIATVHGVQFDGIINGPAGNPTSTNALDIVVDPAGANDVRLIFGAPVTLRSNQSVSAVNRGAGVVGSLIFTNTISDGGNAYGIIVTTNTGVGFYGSNTFTGQLVVKAGGSAGVSQPWTDTVQCPNFIQPSSILIDAGGTFQFGDMDLSTRGTVSPSTVITNNGLVKMGGNLTYSQGTNFGLIVGSGALQCGGNHGAVLLNNPNNSFAGPITFSGDGSPILTFNSIKNVGGGASALGAPTTVAQGTFTLGGYTVTYNGSGDSSDRQWLLSGNGTINASGTTTTNSPFEITSSLTPTGAVRILILGGTGAGKISGNVTNSAYTLTLTKTGTGAWTISGSTFSSGGTLSVGNNNGACGTLYVSSPTATIGDGTNNFLVGTVQSGSASSGIFDSSAAGILTVNSGHVLVGELYGGGNNAVGTAIFGTNTAITATNFIVVGGTVVFGGGGGTNGGNDGKVTNAPNGILTINTPTLHVGSSGSTTWGGATGRINLGTNGVFTLGGPSGSGTSVTIGYKDAGNGGAYTGTIDLSAGTANLTLTNLTVGFTTGNNGTGTGTLTLGTVSTNVVNISGTGNVVRVSYANNTQPANGTVTLANTINSAITSIDGNVAILVGYKSSSGTSTGILNINGGTLTITTTNSAIAGGGGTSRLNLNGCTLISGSSGSNWITGLTTATVSNTVTFNIGAGSVSIPQSFSGAGSLVKSGNSALTLSGTNTISNSFHVQQGTVTFTHTNVMNNAAIYLYTGATNSLPFAGMHTVSDVYVNGVLQPKGEYGTINLPQYITGTGKLKSGNTDFGNKAVTVPGVDDSLKVPNSIFVQ